MNFNGFSLLITTIAVLFCVNISFAQSNYRKGYVILKNGERQSLLIQHKDNAKIFSVIETKLENDSKTQKYFPNDIKEFGLSWDSIYVTKSYDMVTFDEHNNQISKRDTAFMQVMFKGSVTIYFYIDNKDKEHYLIEKEGHGLQELRNSSKYIQTENSDGVTGKNYKKKDNHYIGVLKLLLNDCKSLDSKIEKVELKLNSILDLMKEYQQCMNQEYSLMVYDERDYGMEYEFHVGGILNQFNNIEVNSTQKKVVEIDSKSKYSLNLGANFLYKHKDFSKSMSVQIGFDYSQRTKDFLTTFFTPTRSEHPWTVEWKTLDISIMPRYTHPKLKTPFYVAFGLLYTKNWEKYKTNTSIKQQLNEIPNGGFGWGVELGLRTNRIDKNDFSAGIKYNRKNVLADPAHLRTNSFELRLGYILSKN